MLEVIFTFPDAGVEITLSQLDILVKLFTDLHVGAKLSFAGFDTGITHVFLCIPSVRLTFGVRRTPFALDEDFEIVLEHFDGGVKRKFVGLGTNNVFIALDVDWYMASVDFDVGFKLPYKGFASVFILITVGCNAGPKMTFVGIATGTKIILVVGLGAIFALISVGSVGANIAEGERAGMYTILVG